MGVMLSILTPTYNRVSTLPRLFNSLCEQLDIYFEWVVVDDGSIDLTSKYIKECALNSKFSINLVEKCNGGKHSAINCGVKNAIGEWIFIVDSDDALPKNAVLQINLLIKSAISSDLGGICYRKTNFSGDLIGMSVDFDDPLFLHPTEAAHYFNGDLAYIFKRDKLVSFPFPIIKNEKFVPEMFIWNKIGDVSKILYHPKISLYDCEYRLDGYSFNFKKNLAKNPRGFSLFYKDQFIREKKIVYKFKYFLRWVQCIYLSYLNAFVRTFISKFRR